MRRTREPERLDGLAHRACAAPASCARSRPRCRRSCGRRAARASRGAAASAASGCGRRVLERDLEARRAAPRFTKSTPRRRIVYFQRACLRSFRSPCSFWRIAIARAAVDDLLARGCGRGTARAAARSADCCASCRARRRCRGPRRSPSRVRLTTGTKPTSCVSTSIELSSGCAIPILNLRGRYCAAVDRLVGVDRRDGCGPRRRRGRPGSRRDELRRELLGDRVGELAPRGVVRGIEAVDRRRHHVAVHVAAGAERRRRRGSCGSGSAPAARASAP